jgi:hypothetical protein
MKRLFRPRLTLLRSMVLVAVVAILLTWVVMERRKRIAALMVELQLAEDRFEWAGRMNQRGYGSKSRLTAEQKARDRVRSQLEWLGTSPEHP